MVSMITDRKSQVADRPMSVSMTSKGGARWVSFVVDLHNYGRTV